MAACIDTTRRESCQLSRDPNRSQGDDLSRKFAKCRRPSFCDRVSSMSMMPTCQNRGEVASSSASDEALDARGGEDDLWPVMQEEALSDACQEQILCSYYQDSILSHSSLESALANQLSVKLSNSSICSRTLFDLFKVVFDDEPEIMSAVRADLRAVKQRDPACKTYIHCFLNFKGFLAFQSHRVAHKLWSQGRESLAFLLQNRVSEVFGVDIHPGARIGQGILVDHATGVVVGETAVIGNDVSILHNVTLGGTGKVSGDRHPKIGDGVLIGAGTCILGNITIGDGAKIGAGSVVLKDVPARRTAVGNPARLVGGKENPIELEKLPSFTMDQTSHISECSDYVI